MENERVRCREKHRQLRIAAFQKLGGKCHSCGCDNWSVIEIHHKKPVRRKKIRQGWTDAALRRLLKMSDEEANDYAALACANCHKLEEVHRGANRNVSFANFPVYITST